MNTRLIFLGFLSVVMAFYLKVQADGFGFPDGHLTELERVQFPLNYVFSTLSGVFGLGLFYLSWKPLKLNSNIVASAATAIYIAMILAFIATNYWFGMTLDNGKGGDFT